MCFSSWLCECHSSRSDIVNTRKSDWILFFTRWHLCTNKLGSINMIISTINWLVQPKILHKYYVDVFVKASQLWWSCGHVEACIAFAHQEQLPSNLLLWKALFSWIVFEFKMFLKQWQGGLLHVTHRHFWTTLQLENCHFLWVYGPVTLLRYRRAYFLSCFWKWRALIGQMALLGANQGTSYQVIYNQWNNNLIWGMNFPFYSVQYHWIWVSYLII